MPSTNVTNALDNMTQSLSALGLLAVLALLAVGLTVAMFRAKEPLLGYPSAIMWVIAGADCYLLSTAMWDIYYFMFIAFALGMTLFCILASFAIRKMAGWSPEVNDLDKGHKDVDLFGGDGKSEESPASPRVQAVRKRAAERRGKSWGEE